MTAPGVRMYRGSMVAPVRNAMAKGLVAATARLPEVLTSFGQALERQKIPAGILRDTNIQIAQTAQTAMAEWVDTRSINGKYRPGERLTGTLGEALRSPAMIDRTSANQISIINPAILRSTARHWERVNYGVAGRIVSPEYAPRAYVVMANGEPIMTLRDPRTSPVPGGVYLPRVWVYEGGEFFVLRAWKPKPGARRNPAIGARALRFVNAGLAAIAREVGPSYDAMWRTYAGSVVGQAKLERVGITLTADIRLQGTSWTVDVR